MRFKIGLLILTVWVLVFPIRLVWGAYWESRQLAISGLLTQAVVTELHPGNHDRFKYRFVLSGKAYEGWGQRARDHSVGDTGKVFYLPGNPNRSFWGDPADESRSRLIFFGIMIVFCGGCVAAYRRQALAADGNR